MKLGFFGVFYFTSSSFISDPIFLRTDGNVVFGASLLPCCTSSPTRLAPNTCQLTAAVRITTRGCSCKPRLTHLPGKEEEGLLRGVGDVGRRGRGTGGKRRAEKRVEA